MEIESDDRTKVYPAVGGMNQRVNPTNIQPDEFALVNGMYPATMGSQQRMLGKVFLTRFSSTPIYGFHYSYLGGRNRIIIQTLNTVESTTLDALFGRAFSPTLTSIPIIEEDTMSYAILVHKQNANVGGGGAAFALNTYTQTPITDIVEQKNPDGTAASFVSALAANRFTLTAGTYRFRIQRCMSTANGGRFQAKLVNVTAGTDAWPAAVNTAGTSETSNASANNWWVKFGGTLTLAGSTQFEIQAKTSALNGTAANTLGSPSNAGENEIYAWIEIVKTN